jgi:hypothetical protein
LRDLRKGLAVQTAAFALKEGTLRQTAENTATLGAAPQPEPARHYLFHSRSDEMDSRDDEGAVFTSFSEAYQEALNSAREMIAQKLLTYVPIPWESLIEIADKDGAIVHVVTFRDAAGLSQPMMPELS